ncbi:MAG: hypothetical protein JNM90_06675 [Burkholderiales bacterium]|nr:hypothetical protein [Burkholderiales bacterium]
MGTKAWRSMLAGGLAAWAGVSGVAAQDGYGLHGNGPVVIVAPGTAPGLPGYGYGSAVVPYGGASGVVVTPRGAVPVGRYSKEAARDALRINNALGGARAADEAAARAQAPLTPLNPMPGNLR